jgi:biopolymer transport protein TolR
MGMGGIGGESYGGSRRTATNLSEINVTPLVDVMLVLLIVFMISAPLMQQGVQVDLPKTAATALDEQQESIVLVISRDRKLTINQNEIARRELTQKLAAIYRNKESKEIFIQADQSATYGYVAQIMAEVKRAGITKVGLVTEAPTKE